MILKVIARLRTDFPSKFGVPRQSGLVNTRGTIVFEPEYRVAEALRGIEEYSHLWILWGFSEITETPDETSAAPGKLDKSDKSGGKWSPTVRPPRLGGNKRAGVFATRSPFRPNPVGLSCVKLEKVEKTERDGMVLHVTGTDMVDKTPVYDIKPYLPYVDSHPEAKGGFAEEKKDYRLKVEFPPELLEKVPEDHRDVLNEILSQDPRPAYQKEPGRIYGMEYAGMEVKFRVKDETVEVCGIEK